MRIYLSTTFYGHGLTNLTDVLELVSDLDLDGLELGSTHRHIANPELLVRNHYQGPLVTHNFFPASADTNFVINFASKDEDLWLKSVNHAKYCLGVAASLGAEVYTVHPGFMAMPKTNTGTSSNYDFVFSNDTINHNASFALMISALKELVPQARALGVKLAVETEGSLTNPGVLLLERIKEYEILFAEFPEDLYLNLNLAHSHFAATAHDFSLVEFIQRYYDKIVLVEISHNDGYSDQHKPLIAGSSIFDWLKILPDVPRILEFRNATIEEVRQSVQLMRDYTFEDYT